MSTELRIVALFIRVFRRTSKLSDMRVDIPLFDSDGERVLP